MTGDPVIELRRVGVAFRSERGETPALQDVDLAVGRGEFVCLAGPSGCGKTTLLKIVAGLLPGHAGEVRTAAGERTRLGYVFQEPRLLPWLTAAQNVALPLRTGRFAVDESSGAERARLARERARDWLARVGLAGFEDHYPRELSGGMRQRVALARAFALEPDVLLMDEPFSGLDELTARRLREDLSRTCLESGATVLFVTHNPVEAAHLADRIVVLSPRPGRVVAELRPDLPRPRRTDDPAVFALAAAVVRALEGAEGAGGATGP